MVVLDERSRLSAMGLVDQTRFIRSEIADDILVSAVIAIALVDLWRNALITAEWLKRRIEKREERIRNDGREEGRVEGREEGRVEGREEVLKVLGKDAREEAERKLRRNGESVI